MLSLGPLAFAAPWALVALLGLPVLWWLLRVTPPAPRFLRFPAIRLLFGLRKDEQTPARTPLWLILLRMAIATLVILGLAHPLLNPGAQFAAPGPLLLVVDDGWAAARGWTARQRAMTTLIDRAERAGRPVMVLTTAEPAEGGPLAASDLLTAAAARGLVQALEPKPWPTARAKALEALKAAAFDEPANIVWLTDGLEEGASSDFGAALEERGAVTVMRDAPDGAAVALAPPEAGDTRLAARLMRAEGGDADAYWLRGLDERGRVLLRERVAFAEGATSAETALAVPPELRNRLARLEVETVASAGAVVLMDERWRRRPVGIAASADRGQVQPLLSEIYYLERALGPYAEVRKGPVGQLLSRALAVLVLPDAAALGEQDMTQVTAWMERGGTVLRFAGPRLAENPDDLAPVRLRRGDRTLGGAMSWAQPARLAPFEEASPFAGLPVPEDVVVSRQVLAQPSLDLPGRSWARLADGTPLVTAEARGRGRVILVHTTANTDWSNLPLSGLFVEMLRRIVNLSQGVAGAQARSLPPLTTLDGFGRLTDPPAAAQPLTTEPAAAPPAGDKAPPVRLGPTNPPGFYGTDTARFALNLTDGMTALAPLAPLPASVEELRLAAPEEVDFKPWALALALALLILDMWIGLVLRGLAPAVWPFRGAAGDLPAERPGGAAAAMVLALGLAASAALAAPAARAQDGPLAVDERRAMEATFDTRLAYVVTGDPRLDSVSRAGLEGLSLTLRSRTSVEPKAPLAVDIERDELSLFPFLYWPVSESQPLPSRAARDRLAQYLRTGGMILFDTRDQALGGLADPGGPGAAGPGAARLRDILRGFRVPALIPVPKDHILTKAFYLLSEFPGRWTGGTLWVERLTGYANDGVSSVVIGANDFAAAWAVDEAGQPLYPVVPGGARQREMAHRFGVNIVMYALTGNYKSDQVHVPAILERLGQ